MALNSVSETALFSLVNQNQTIHNSKPEKNKFDLLIGWHVFSKLIDWTEI